MNWKTGLANKPLAIILAALLFSAIFLHPAPRYAQAAAKAATIVSHTIPSAMKAGVGYTVSVTVRNDGTSTWTEPDGFRLGAVEDSDPFAAGRQNFPAGQAVRPGEVVTFTFQMTAPGQAGVYTTDWRMVHEFVEWFGAILTVNVSVSSTVVQNAATMISNTIPDVMAKGHIYPVTVTVRNDGQGGWHEGALYRLGGVGDSDPFAHTRYIITGNSVATGQIVSFTFMMKAPDAAGTYTTDWRMVQDSVEWFGATLTKTVNVVDGIRNAAIVAQTIPDVMEIGQTYTVSITVRNMGNTTWFEDHSAVGKYRLGAVGDADPFAPGRVILPTNVVVQPGEPYTFQFQMTAPSVTGVYGSDWRMLQEGVTWFGEIFTRNVAVIDPSRTAGYYYDAEGRLESVKLPSGETIYSYYDTNGNLIRSETR